jgi:hypothetical protein
MRALCFEIWRDQAICDKASEGTDATSVYRTFVLGIVASTLRLSRRV